MVRKMITTETRGKQCGTVFDDRERLKEDLERVVIQRIVLTYSDYINSLAVCIMPGIHGIKILSGIGVLRSWLQFYCYAQWRDYCHRDG